MVVGINAIEKETIVIGAGPGGYVAAIRAAEEGQDVALVERYDTLGGVCLNVGCIPSKALIQAGNAYEMANEKSAKYGISSKADIDFKKTQEWKDNEVVAHMTSGVEFLMKKHKIEVLHGLAYINNDHELTVQHEEDDGHELYKFQNLIVATGSRPVEIPGFKFKDRVIDSTGALNLPEIPKRLVVIGGGIIGSELGSAYANLGSKVTILEGTEQILPMFEKDIVKTAQKSMEDKGMEIVTSAMAKKAEQKEDSVTVTYEVDGKSHQVTADYVLVSVGRRPNTDDIGLEAAGVEIGDRGLVKVDEQGRTSSKHIYAIGDIVPGPALAHKASYEGIVAAEAIAGKASAVDYRAMPSVAYIDPEIAKVGLTKKEAKEQGIEAHDVKFPLSANGRAVAMGEATGFLRLTATKDDNIIIGGEMIGPDASDVISEVGLAVEGGLTAEDIALTIHGHPTLTEMIKDAAEALLGQPINI